MHEQQHEFLVQKLSDQEVTQRYGRELLKLKTLTQVGRHSERFLGYPNTLVMNLCRQELERRGLPIPPVNPAGKDEDNADHSGSTSDESGVAARKDNKT